MRSGATAPVHAISLLEGLFGILKRKKIFTRVTVLHYIRLCYRSALLVGFLLLYVLNRIWGDPPLLSAVESYPLLIGLIWIVFMYEMICRFFPSSRESPGCQKQFRQNYVPTGATEPILHDNNGTVLVALIWVVMNGILGALHMSGALDDEIMMLIALVYSVCDMICILFFCPFQTWILKNKCCSGCRIYNWDYAMMFTPLFFVRKVYTYSLLLMSVALLLRWEITVYLYPERFSEKTNAYLKCANCTEKLCGHKTQLQKFWKTRKLQERIIAARILLKSREELLEGRLEEKRKKNTKK